MSTRELIAAWLGLIGLVSGVIVFGYFVYPQMKAYYFG